MFIEFPEKTEVIIQGLESIEIPEMITIEAMYDNTRIDDVPEYLAQKFQENISKKERFRGKRIAVTVGSRGIPNLLEIVKTICDQLKAWGASPFIVPAMGSHGGGTVSGQLEVLDGYHITESTVGVPILATLDVIKYGELPDGMPLYCNKYALEADGIVVFNKVKPHTDFRGDYESGLAKMIAVGLASHKGASFLHGAGVFSFANMIPEIAKRFLAERDMVIGVGVVQNAYDDICAIEAVEQEDMLRIEKELLILAKERLGKLKFKQCDILVIEQIGKNISGTGADPNVTGRPTAPNAVGFSDTLDVSSIVVFGLTPESHHNGCGIGIVDVTTRACLNDIDWGSTWTNHINSAELHCSKIPFYANNEHDALALAILNLPYKKRKCPKIAWIRNTLELSRLKVSPALYEDIKDNDDIKMIEPAAKLRFDGEGNLF